ncbi:hypothetical protein [Granulicella sibirica]|uniref:CmpX n=1 Tax=Granulicella sibirica TaxID=2479048 RepID=A0A4Q0T5B2_9BACT|nr:hypothetical protein [Granulicella sibirica]RXH57209.1 hypothetical protein GRAN_0519 [Granulicella sibirica]
MRLLQPDQPLQNFQPMYSESPSIWHNMGDALHQSVLRVLSLLISILPGFLALLLAVIVLTLIGLALSVIVKRILTSVRFDDRLASNQSSGIADWSPSHSPTLLASRTVLWGCVLLGLVIGISAFSASYSSDSQTPYVFLPYLTRSVGAILLLVVGNLIARFLARSVLIGAVNQKLQYARFLSGGVKWLVLVLTGAMVLDHLQIGGTIVELAFGILFGGIVLTLSLAIGLGSRDLVSRSIEKSIDRSDLLTQRDPMEPLSGVETGETLRHF